MRLVTWNCSMAFDRKYQALERLRPDIAVIPECANPDILRRKDPLFKPSDMQWVGVPPNKGLAVFAFNGFKLNISPQYDLNFKYILPVHALGQGDGPDVPRGP